MNSPLISADTAPIAWIDPAHEAIAAEAVRLLRARPLDEASLAPINKSGDRIPTEKKSLLAAACPAHCLTEAEVSDIQKIIDAAPGAWFAVPFDCECCGNTTVSIGPTPDWVPGPWFDILRESSGRILLTTRWLDGEDYDSQHWSISATLSVVLSTIAKAMAEMGMAA